MKQKQLNIFGGVMEYVKPIDKQKRAWENSFQRWCNKQAQNEHDDRGICGFGSMCDYCEDNTYGRPCVRALNAMCRDKGMTIDYSKRNYDDIWYGKENGDENNCKN